MTPSEREVIEKAKEELCILTKTLLEKGVTFSALYATIARLESLLTLTKE